MKLFFFRTTIYIYSPLQIKQIRIDYDPIHRIFHPLKLQTPIQLLLSDPKHFLSLPEDPKQLSMLYLALIHHNTHKPIPSYIPSLKFTHPTTIHLQKLLSNDLATIEDLRDDDFLGYTLFMNDKKTLENYYRLQSFNNEEMGIDLYNELVELAHSGALDGMNVQAELHKSFCLFEAENTVDSFIEEYKKMLEMIFNDDPFTECGIKGYGEVDLFNELVRYRRGGKLDIDNVKEWEAITLNQRGVQQYVREKYKAMKLF